MDDVVAGDVLQDVPELVFASHGHGQAAESRRGRLPEARQLVPEAVLSNEHDGARRPSWCKARFWSRSEKGVRCGDEGKGAWEGRHRLQLRDCKRGWPRCSGDELLDTRCKLLAL